MPICFSKKKSKKQNKKTYTYYQLVEAYATAKGPRQRVVVSLGDLSPRPREKWLELVREVEAALSGQEDFTVEELSEEARGVAQRIREKRGRKEAQAGGQLVPICLEGVHTKAARELGPEYVGVTIWERLGLDEILASCGLSRVMCRRVKVMGVNALCEYESEHAMPGWANRTAIGDLVGLDCSRLSESSLYRTLDALLPHRERIEQALADREATLFQLPESIVLYDLTSTYFEGEMKRNPLAKRGYSRDRRADCKQVVMGLILDMEGFVKGHMLFEGNRKDGTTLEEMVSVLDERVGHEEATVVMDRGLATKTNLEWLRDQKRSYIVAARQGDREGGQERFVEEEWEEVIRADPPTQPGKKRARVEVKREEREGELYVLCRSAGRKEKDAAIRKRFADRMERDLERLRRRVASGRLRQRAKLHEAVGEREIEATGQASRSGWPVTGAVSARGPLVRDRCGGGREHSPDRVESGRRLLR
jgi:hypothetical protein